jgi:hypothetical protein
VQSGVQNSSADEKKKGHDGVGPPIALAALKIEGPWLSQLVIWPVHPCKIYVFVVIK